jgi:hypothetical protein
MRSKSIPLLLGVILAILGTPSSFTFAKTQGYCVECHTKEVIKDFALTEYRSIYHTKLDPCPGIRTLSEEIFFTESRIIKLDEILQNIDDEGRTKNTLIDEVSKTAETMPRLKGENFFSMVEVKQNASSLRASLQKVYDRTFQIRDGSDRRWLIGVGSLIFLGILSLIGVGYWKLNRMGKALLILLISGTLASTSCSFGPAEPKKKSPAQEDLEQALRVASQSTTKMEEMFYQSILLAEMAGEWSKIEPGPAERAFDLAWAMVLKAREKSNQISTLHKIASQYTDQEVASKRKVDFNTVLDLRDELRDGDDRTWALRSIAEEWMKVDKKKGRKALELATQKALTMKDEEVRDRELKSIAEGWAGMDQNQAKKIARSIRDPFLKAMALTRIAERKNDRNLFEETWKIVETLPPSYSQAKAFIWISTAATRIHPNGKEVWLKRVSEKIKKLKHPRIQAFATQEAIGQWISLDREQSERWASEISPLFPEIRAYSLIQMADCAENPKENSLSLLKGALRETEKITDLFEAKKIRYLIANDMIKLEPEEAIRILPKIEDAFYRSEILRELAKQFSLKDKKKGLHLAEKIPLETFRMEAIVEIIGQWMDQDRKKIGEIYQKALPVILSISDPYQRALILIQIGKDWKKLEQGKEIFLFDLALKATKEITSPSMRAEILETLAEEWKNLDRKKSGIILDEIDLSVSQVRKLLEEIQLWSKTEPFKALPWAEKMPPSFLLEKASAFREVATGMKKVNPSLSFGLYEKALTLGLTFPDGSRRDKSLSPLVKEMVLLNREKTLQRLLLIEGQETRDFLLREAGNHLVREDPLWFLKFVREISEGSLRLPLYQKMADEETKRPSSQKRATILFFSHWGQGRLKAKKDELRAVPHYEKALQEIEKVPDLQDRSNLLSALVTDWTLIDEEKALKVAEKIPSNQAEPFSYALLQIGTHLRKFNRKEAHSLFERALLSSSQIQNPLLRAKRYLQIAKEWQVLDQKRGREILERAEKEARKGLPINKIEGVLYEILLTQIHLKPDHIFRIGQQSGSPLLQAKILIEVANRLSKITIEENIKTLEAAYPFAQASKNPSLLGEIGIAWSSLDMKKGLEIINQVGSREIRLDSLRRIAKRSTIEKQQANSLLGQASEEALRIDDLKEKIKTLKEIAGDWLSIDKEQAKRVYRLTYRMVEKATF